MPDDTTTPQHEAARHDGDDADADEAMPPPSPPRRAPKKRTFSQVSTTSSQAVTVPRDPILVAVERRFFGRPGGAEGTEEGGGEDSTPHRHPRSCNHTDLPLKRDAANRPLWIAPNGHIYLEAFNPLHEQVQDFLVTIAEPVSRPTYIHEYRITPHSLYAAISVGLETDDIINALDRFSKIPVPEEICSFIRRLTASFGKVKLVLRENKYWVESAYPEVLQMLLRDEEIMKARDRLLELQGTADKAQGITTMAAPHASQDLLATFSSAPKGDDATAKPKDGPRSDLWQAMLKRVDDEDEAQEDLDGSGMRGTKGLAHVHAFQIDASSVEDVKHRCKALDYPLAEEYDFRRDTLNANLDIDLKPATLIRPYQEKSLSKMFGNGRARSGIIVLPCGAGKTLVGITAACTVKKSVLVLCTSSVSVAQWRSQFKFFSTIRDRQIARFTSDEKEKFSGTAGIVVSTYTMVAFSGKRSHDAQKMMEFLESQEWGLLILDEVHVVPANVFRRVLTTIPAHAKLGLTATLVREDDKIEHLNYLIGPKLYEANWRDLARQGHIANVQCAEVWCPMTPEFYREYLNETSRKRKLLYVMNPRKFQACQFLIQFHEARGDKIIVFSDNVFALKAYALKLKKPFIYGPTSQTERMRILQQFQSNPLLNCIFLSKVGDTSIDLPEATCLIQISSHYGSRRQEAQRLGRILRAKRRNDEGFNAYFYSLVSKDTQEMYYSSKRQQFLIDQGYSFKVITKLQGIEATRDLVYVSPHDQRELLQTVLMATDVDAKEEDVSVADDLTATAARGGVVRRTTGSMKSFSGGDSMAYLEMSRADSTSSVVASVTKKPRHALFRERERLRRK